MRLNPVSKFFVILSCLVLLNITSSAQAVPIQTISNNSGFSDIKITFPDIEGWEKSEVTKYPIPELGYSINYESGKGGRVTVYVYNGGNKTIPSNLNNKVLKGEIDKAKGEIQKVAEMGVYQNLKEVLNNEVVLGGEEGKVKALHSLFNFSARGQQLTSEIFLFGYQNHFIKLRATRKYEKEETENQPMTDLLKAMDDLFAVEGTIASAD